MLAIVGFAHMVMGSEVVGGEVLARCGAVIIRHIAVAGHRCDSVGPVRS